MKKLTVEEMRKLSKNIEINGPYATPTEANIRTMPSSSLIEILILYEDFLRDTLSLNEIEEAKSYYKFIEKIEAELHNRERRT